MKLTYKNLCNVRLTKNGYFRKKTMFLLYKESCKNCGEPFLCSKQLKSDYCCNSCYQLCRPKEHSKKLYKNRSKNATGKNNSMYGIKLMGKNNGNYKGGYSTNNLASFESYSHKLSPMEQVRRHPTDYNLLQVKCTYCNKWFTPKLHSVSDRVSYINGVNKWENRFYCSEGCKDTCPIFGKELYPKGFKKATSREVQSELRKIVLKRDNWTCQKCNKTIKEVPLHCHHILPLNESPIESADVSNCITLCKECHKNIHKLPGCSYYDLRCN